MRTDSARAQLARIRAEAAELEQRRADLAARRAAAVAAGDKRNAERLQRELAEIGLQAAASAELADDLAAVVSAASRADAERRQIDKRERLLREQIAACDAQLGVIEALQSVAHALTGHSRKLCKPSIVDVVQDAGRDTWQRMLPDQVRAERATAEHELNTLREQRQRIEDAA